MGLALRLSLLRTVVETSLMLVNDKPSTSRRVLNSMRSLLCKPFLSRGKLGPVWEWENQMLEIKVLHQANRSGSCLSSCSGYYEIELEGNVPSTSAQALKDDVQEVDKYVTSLPFDPSKKDNEVELEKKVLSSTLDLKQKEKCGSGTEKSKTVRKLFKIDEAGELIEQAENAISLASCKEILVTCYHDVIPTRKSVHYNSSSKISSLLLNHHML